MPVQFSTYLSLGAHTHLFETWRICTVAVGGGFALRQLCTFEANMLKLYIAGGSLTGRRVSDCIA